MFKSKNTCKAEPPPLPPDGFVTRKLKLTTVSSFAFKLKIFCCIPDKDISKQIPHPRHQSEKFLI